MRIAPGPDTDDAALAAVCDRYGIAELKAFGLPSPRHRRTRQRHRRPVLPAPRTQARWEIEQLADEPGSLLGHHVDLVSLRALHPRNKPGRGPAPYAA